MDYLDPKKKKAQRIQLMIGYVLLGIAISIATVVFVYLANGYYIDRETGVVIQNGLIYVDSRPETANVFLNGVQQNGTTDARLVVPEGVYDIELRRTGYKSWNRNLRLEGGKLRRLTYARLIPEELNAESVVSLATLPSAVSQSNDKRWLVLAYSNNKLQLQYIDLNRTTLALTELPLPLDLITATIPGEWKILEWADDQKVFLAEYRTAEGVEYVLIDRDDPAKSKNVSKLFSNVVFTEVSLRDRKNDLLFLHDTASGNIYRANAGNGQSELFVEGAVDYVAYGNDAVLYVTRKDAGEGMVKAVLKKGDTLYPLRDIHADSTYLLEMARNGNALVMGIGSPAENRIIVYNDPINALRQNDFSTLPVPTTVLRVEKPEELTISSDASVILARGGQKFATHEFEEDRTYVFDTEYPITSGQELNWMDGQHIMMGVAENDQLVMDFDGSNQLLLSKSQPTLGSIFDGPINRQFTFNPPGADGSAAQLVRTFLRTPADR